MNGRTRHFVIDPTNGMMDATLLEEAGALLRDGKTVAFGTETVYGLGANALDEQAVAKIFAAKGRPSWDPLIVHIADVSMLSQVAESVPQPAYVWMEQFWPGPLTLLLPRGENIPLAVTAGRDRVGVRIPAHPVARALLKAAGVPIAAPSANRFGHVSPTTAAHVLADLEGRIDAIVDSGPSLHGVESTVVDACEDPCLVYRPGAVTLEQLAAAWPRIRMFRELGIGVDTAPASLPSPGVGIRHYAPRAKIHLVEHSAEQPERFLAAVQEAAYRETASRTGVLLPKGFLNVSHIENMPVGLEIFPWGVWDEPATLAHDIFGALRALDAAGVVEIICPLPKCEGLGTALCDRLRKAAMPKRN